MFETQAQLNIICVKKIWDFLVIQGVSNSEDVQSKHDSSAEPSSSTQDGVAEEDTKLATGTEKL